MKVFVCLFYAFMFFAPSFIACQKEPLANVSIVRAVPDRVTFYDVYGVKSVQVIADKSPESDLFLFSSKDTAIYNKFKVWVKDSATVRIYTQHETIVSGVALLKLK